MPTAPLLRPTFSIALAVPRDEAVDTLRRRFAETPELAGRWRAKGNWAELHLIQSESRIWSPYLSIRVDDRGDASSIFGRFAPEPEVWTFFMFLYFLIAFITLFGSTLGYVQWASGEPAWGLWALWIGVPSLLVIHLASAVGARLGQDQMRRLRQELDDLLAAAPGLEAVPD